MKVFDETRAARKPTKSVCVLTTSALVYKKRRLIFSDWASVSSNCTSSGMKCDLCDSDCYLEFRLHSARLPEGICIIQMIQRYGTGNGWFCSMWPGREKPFEKYLPCWNVVIVSAHMRVMANSLGVKFRGVRVSPWQGGIWWVVAVYYSSVISVALTMHIIQHLYHISNNPGTW